MSFAWWDDDDSAEEDCCQELRNCSSGVAVLTATVGNRRMDGAIDKKSEATEEAPQRGAPIGRAAFLGMVAAGLGGILVAPRISGGLNSALARAVPAPLRLGPKGGWRIYSVAAPMPTFDPARYTLAIGGLVRRPRMLRWPEIERLAGEEQVSDFHCVTGWSVNDVRWEGIRAATILEMARPLPSARYLTLFSLEEPYAEQISMEQFNLRDVMLARHMDGRPLTREHGAPLRLVIPEMYGYKGAKWVSALRFDAEPGLGYWEQRGYDVNAWVGRSNGLGA